jgi:DNA-directed RNA polymerase specialized sigma24 family protein
LKARLEAGGVRNPETESKAVLEKILARRVADWHRGPARQIPRGLDPRPRELEAVEAGSSMGDIRAAEVRTSIIDALYAMPRLTAQVFVATEIQGIDARTVAERLGLTENAVWIRAYRARRQLQEALS